MLYTIGETVLDASDLAYEVLDAGRSEYVGDVLEDGLELDHPALRGVFLLTRQAILYGPFSANSEATSSAYRVRLHTSETTVVRATKAEFLEFGAQVAFLEAEVSLNGMPPSVSTQRRTHKYALIPRSHTKRLLKDGSRTTVRTRQEVIMSLVVKYQTTPKIDQLGQLLAALPVVEAGQDYLQKSWRRSSRQERRTRKRSMTLRN